MHFYGWLNLYNKYYFKKINKFLNVDAFMKNTLHLKTEGVFFLFMNFN